MPFDALVLPVSLESLSNAFPRTEPLTPETALVEIARRVYGPVPRQDDATARLMAPLVSALDGPASTTVIAVPSLIPLERWRALVNLNKDNGSDKDNRSDGPSLFRRIALDRAATLVYHGLARMDEPTRAFLAGHPALLARIYRDHAAVFAITARSLQVTGGALLAGRPAVEQAAWEKVAGAPVSDAERFILSLLQGDNGRLAYVFDAVTGVPGAAGFVTGGDRDRATRNLSALRKAVAAMDPFWRPDLRPFVRPAADLEFILTRLGPDFTAGPVWPLMLDRVFQEGAVRGVNDMLDVPFWNRRAIPADLVTPEWIATALIQQPPAIRRARLDTVLYARRALADEALDYSGEVEVILKGRYRFPAPFAALERAGVRGKARLAEVARRISEFTGQDPETYRGFQAAFALIDRAAASGGLSPDNAAALVSSLMLFPRNRESAAGWMANWLEHSWLRSPVSIGADQFAGAHADAVTLALVAGMRAGRPEATIVTWEGDRYAVDPWRANFNRFQSVRAIEKAPTLEDALACAAAARTGSTRTTTSSERRACDAEIDDALTALVYAAALGPPSGPVRLVPDLYRRHDFGADMRPDLFGGRLPWALPIEQPPESGRWSVRGSVIGLDIALARHTLTRLRQDVMPERPTMRSASRQSLALVPVLMRPEDLMPDSPNRGKLVSAVAATGCLCLTEPSAGLWERAMASGPGGDLELYVPDLAHRLSAELERLQLPPILLPALLAVATTDLVEGARLGHADDRQAIAAWVLRLAPADIADYVSSLTAHGPLIPRDRHLAAPSPRRVSARADAGAAIGHHPVARR